MQYFWRYLADSKINICSVSFAVPYVCIFAVSACTNTSLIPPQPFSNKTFFNFSYKMSKKSCNKTAYSTYKHQSINQKIIEKITLLF